jgi:hypothetical protein
LIPFLSNGDKVTITYEDSKKVHDIIEIKWEITFFFLNFTWNSIDINCIMYI